MKFELNDYHRNMSDEEFISDVHSVTTKLCKNTLTSAEYNKYGKYHSSTLIRRFGSWVKVLEKCDMEPAKPFTRNPANENVSNEQLLLDLRETALKLGVSTLTTTQYDAHGKHKHNIFNLRFGKWETALVKAGLQPTGFHRKISTQEMFEEIERVWVLLGRQPTTTDIKNGISTFSLQSYARRFGGWRGALQAFVGYINAEETEAVEETASIEISTTSSENKSIAERIIIPRKTSRDVNLRLRFMVMQRDNFKCCACGASPATTPGAELHIDHIIPWSKGGETTIDNLQTLCNKCNLGKSDLL